MNCVPDRIIPAITISGSYRDPSYVADMASPSRTMFINLRIVSFDVYRKNICFTNPWKISRRSPSRFRDGRHHPDDLAAFAADRKILPKDPATIPSHFSKSAGVGLPFGWS